MRKYAGLAVALIGVAFTVYWVAVSIRQPVSAAAVSPPAESSFERTIAGSGIIEAAGRNVSLAPAIPGLVTAVFVRESDVVRRGSPLFQIDDREKQAQLASKDAEIRLAAARAALARADIMNQEAFRGSAEANIAALQAALEDAEQNLERNAALKQKGVLAEREYLSSRKTRDAAAARVDQGRAQLEQAIAQQKAAEARLAEAEAQRAVLGAELRELRVLLERLTVIAPHDGRILQVNVRPGQYAAPTAAEAPVLFGETDSLQVRVDVDEINASRVAAGSAAVAHLKGDAGKRITLEFVRIDPYIVPKKSLTGDNKERVDVRVLQVVYRFTPPAFPVYVGQQVDVFIDAAPVGGDRSRLGP